MKKFFGTILSIIVGLVSWVIFVSICAIIFGAIYDANLPDWTVLVNLTLPLLLAIVGGKIFYNRFTKEGATTLLYELKLLFINIKHFFIRILPNSITNKRAENGVPKSPKKQLEVSRFVFENINQNLQIANQAVRVSVFTTHYDKVITDLAYLVNFEQSLFEGSPAAEYNKLREEYQLHLCDAIVRAKEYTRTEINTKYRNSREFQQKAVFDFENDINTVKIRFTQGTLELYNKSAVELRELVNLEIPEDLQNFSKKPKHTVKKHSAVFDELAYIDTMDGHDFEYWCAEALENSGFSNVEVTPGSGDQGVDVLATKDGIRYAVQCKRYNSDLGNTPVQEVHSGKVFYHCHIGAVMTNRYFTSGAKKLAQETGTLLWDRDWIIDYLNKKQYYK